MAERCEPGVTRVYVASKSCHGPMWQQFRAAWQSIDIDVKVVSTWIDESGEGETGDMGDLWLRCIQEASSADLVIAYHAPGEEWKGAFVEIGAALASGAYVYVVGRPPGSWVNHPLVTFASDPDDALDDFLGRTCVPAPDLPDDDEFVDRPALSRTTPYGTRSI